jgi:leucyl/phenylalanyl-tRNA--protein transferase
MQLTILDPNNPEQEFPALDKALREPDGLLAVGGCLSVSRLINAYRHGIFPWYNAGEPILWWSPDPRLVLFPDRIKVSRSLRKTIKKKKFSISYDQAFDEVIAGCAGARKGSLGTWITRDISRAYKGLFQLGLAHSAEAWYEGKLVGGLYGIALGRVFFGESMFHTMTDASKVAFITLVEQLGDWGYQLIDCQVHTEHLESLGAEKIDRKDFVELLGRYCETQANAGAWGNR